MDSQKQKSRLLKIVKIGTITGAVVTVLSFIISAVPCIKKSGISLCRIPSPLTDLSDLDSRYWGLSNNPITALVLQFLIPLFLVAILMLLVKRKKSKILDFTKK